jgi:hypothetical protein
MSREGGSVLQAESIVVRMQTKKKQPTINQRGEPRIHQERDSMENHTQIRSKNRQTPYLPGSPPGGSELERISERKSSSENERTPNQEPSNAAGESSKQEPDSMENAPRFEAITRKRRTSPPSSAMERRLGAGAHFRKKVVVRKRANTQSRTNQCCGESSKKERNSMENAPRL